MNRKFAWVVFALFCRFFLFAQTPSVRLGVLKGISCSPCAYLIANKEKLSVQNMAFKVFDSEQSELPALLKGEIDMGFLAPEDAAKVFSKGNGALICVGVVQNGSLCLLTSDESYSSLQDLRGKKILAAGDAQALLRLIHCILRQQNKLKAMGKRLSAMDDNTRKDAARMLDEEFGFSLGMTPEQASAYICEKLNIG